MFLLAQVLSSVAGIFMMLSVLGLTNEKFLKLQSVDCIANVLADVLLGGWVGVILCLGGLVRNNLDILEEKIGIQIDVRLVTAVSCGVAAIFAISTHQFIIVVAAELVYTFALFKTEGLKLEVLLAVDLACWFFYDLSIKSYPMAIVDAIVFIRALFVVSREMEDGQIIQVATKGSEFVKEPDNGETKEEA